MRTNFSLISGMWNVLHIFHPSCSFRLRGKRACVQCRKDKPRSTIVCIADLDGQAFLHCLLLMNHKSNVPHQVVVVVVGAAWPNSPEFLDQVFPQRLHGVCVLLLTCVWCGGGTDGVQSLKLTITCIGKEYSKSLPIKTHSTDYCT